MSINLIDFNLKDSKRIIGVDPGTNILGYSIIDTDGKKFELVKIGIIKMSKLNGTQAKLQSLFSNLSELIEAYKPTEMAVEAPFYGKNVQSMLKLGRAQGVAIAAGLRFQLSVNEYSPRKIKQSVTGNGNASKEQVAAMLRQILYIPNVDLELDATDALATALCHCYQANQLFARKKYKDWKSFVENNPGKKK